MVQIQADKTIDCKGMACPMPIIKTKKAMDELLAGQVIEVVATDKGSLADIQGWSRNTGHQYLGTMKQGDVLKHYLRKSNPTETKEENKYPKTTSNEELMKKLNSNESIMILDVRESAEYVFNRIPGAKSIPLGELEKRMSELQSDQELHVVCRTGTRSDIACQMLKDKGFKLVYNVIPGMSAWEGPTENDVQ
ncbi:sulfurtransferase TusA family protein [Bacillus sp. FJAT-28004]|uniref:sulfurtransferase TusA family protein n=1 Tax=Bacillus sp. FJAT-28004 TaxID=1679165 RepID=UPI0006B5C9D8|nr:sulfurtransferase TusA family protein [Bacillus sp. FJAT-28004]